MKIFLLLLFGSVFPLCAQISAVPNEMSYQALLKDDQGRLIALENPEIYEVTVKIWSSPIDGELIWAEQQTASVFRGRLAITLGQGTIVPGDDGPLPRPDFTKVFAGENHFSEISFKSLSDVNAIAETLSSRQKLVPVSTALRAAVADSLASGLILDRAALKQGGFESAPFSNGAFTSEKFANDTITSSNVADGVVTQDRFAADAITGAKILDGSIERADLGSAAVDASLLAHDSVTSAAVSDGVVLGSKFPAGIDGSRFQDGTLLKSDFDFQLSSLAIQPNAQIDQVVYSSSPRGPAVLTFDPSVIGFPTEGVSGAILRVNIPRRNNTPAKVIVFPGSDHEYPLNTLNMLLANSIYIPQGRFTDSLENVGDSDGEDISSNENNTLGYSVNVHCPLRKLPNGHYEAKFFVGEPNANVSGYEIGAANETWQATGDSKTITMTVIGSY